MEEPLRRVAMDLIGPLSPVSDRGNRNRYVLIIVDYATRYPEAVPLAKIETDRAAKSTAACIVQVGFPKEVLRYRGVLVCIRLDV